VSLKCGQRLLQAGRHGAGRFPACRAVGAAAWINLEAKTLREIAGLDQFRDLARRDALRAERRALRADRQGCAARGDDGHRLALASRTVGNVGNAVTGIVPRKAILEIQRVLGAGEEVQIALTREPVPAAGCRIS